MLESVLSILILATSFTLAAPPDIDCLSDLTVEEAFEQRKHSRPKNIIFLVSGSGLPSDAWESSVWNDPEFVDYLKKSGITVVHMDRETDPVLYEILKIESTPTFVYYHESILTKRTGLAHATYESRASLIEWVDAAKRGTTLSRIMQKELESDPGNIELRFELVKELDNEGRGADSLDCMYWLLDKNDLFYQYVINQDIYKDLDVSDFEMYFRASLLWFINGPRDNLGLYKQEKSRVDGYPPRDGWAEAINQVDQNRINTDRDRKIEVLVSFRRQLEARRDNNTATDRDLFILKALTAEGDELKQLFDQYEPYMK